MSFYLNGVALVTGAGSGIGRECALGYAAEGARGVVLADLSYEPTLDAAQESETLATNPAFKAIALRIDPTDLASVAEMIVTAMRLFGRIDYFVNSGWTAPPALEGTDSDNKMWQANATGTIHCVRAVAQVMRNQQVGKYKSRGRVRESGRGTIIIVGAPNSMNAPRIEQGGHGTLGLTRKAALDSAAHGIRVNTVCPGWVGNADENVDAQMLKSIVPISRTARPEEIADVVLFLSSPRASYVTGAAWTVDGGMTLRNQTPETVG
ncbi:hypothetical protein BDW59DRAFT_160942 [Aspergillus cavernicola]|uniref:Oxidoreductase n=1 Tax=Aspergillus cavernicola TaxID=176166 RepID=A0ABR4IF71_9EURO